MAWKQAVNKPTAKPAVPKPKFETKDDDWDTDTSYQSSASVTGPNRVDHVDFNTIQDKIKTFDQSAKEDFKEKHPTRGYGGKYGTEQVMDKSAEGFSYKADVKKHSSQTDGKKGFGGEHGIDERAKDNSAVGFDYKPAVEKHSSQTTAQQDVKKEEPSMPPAAPPKPLPKPKVAEKPAPTTPDKADVGNIRARFENMKKEKEAEATNRVAEERKKRTTTDQQVPQEEQPKNNDEEEVKQQETPPATKETIQEPSPASPKTPPVPAARPKIPPVPAARPKIPPVPAARPKIPPVPAARSKTSVPPPSREVSTENIYENLETATSAAPKPDENDDNNTAQTETSTDNVETVTSTTNEKNTEEPAKFVGGIDVTSILRHRKTSSSSSKNGDDADEWAVKKDEIDPK